MLLETGFNVNNCEDFAEFDILRARLADFYYLISRK